MSKEETKEKMPKAEEVKEKQDAAQPEQEQQTEAVKDPKDQKIEQLEKKLAELKDQHLRTLAEYDNFRKRTEKEKAGIYHDAVIATVSEVLPIGDNIERALAQKDCSAEDMRKGVEMMYQQFQATLKKLDIEEMAGEGEEFNPELHNAVSHIEDETLGENVISSVFQKGYMLKDKVLRHAMVQVAN